MDVVRIFGDTKHKGGGSLPIWLRYDHIGMDFGFLFKDWADAANPIAYIKIFAKSDEPQTECTLCLKSFKSLDSNNFGHARCEGCGLMFCNKPCLNEFLKVH